MNIMLNRQNEDEGAACSWCGAIKVAASSGDGTYDSKEVISIQNKYSHLMQQRQKKINDLEDQLIACRNQLDDQNIHNSQQNSTLSLQVKKLQNKMSQLNADKEKYHAQKEKYCFQNVQLNGELD